MTRRFFWNRRSGQDRRQHNDTHFNRQRTDRRDLIGNHYRLIIGDSGLDDFELMSLLTIGLLLTAMFFTL